MLYAIQILPLKCNFPGHCLDYHHLQMSAFDVELMTVSLTNIWCKQIQLVLWPFCNFIYNFLFIRTYDYKPNSR